MIRDADNQHTRSSCSRMQECRSSPHSWYLRAYWAAFCAEVTDALSWRSWFVKRMRTSNGSAMVFAGLDCEFFSFAGKMSDVDF